MIYADHAATTPLRREALESMWPFLTNVFGNPSSTHEVGMAARAGLEDARARIAAVVDCNANEVVFTSGGTEAANLAVHGIALANPKGRRIVTTPVEHEGVLACCRWLEANHGFELVFVDVDEYGMVDLGSLEASVTPDTTLCTVMYANNEIGTVQPVEEISRICRSNGVDMHLDAVQAPGLLPVDTKALDVGAMSLASHKFGGPKGVGILYIRSDVELKALIAGGGQERGRRSGTENVSGAVGMATALEIAERTRCEVAPALRAATSAIIASVLNSVKGAFLTGHPSLRLANHASFCFPGAFGETVLLELERHGVICSSGSACASNSPDVSHVLTALGLDADTARTAVRITVGPELLDGHAAEIGDLVVRSVENVRNGIDYAVEITP